MLSLRKTDRGLLAVATWLLAGSLASSQDPIEGFVTPLRTIHLATAETGIIHEMLVREGETVEAGQIVAHLDDEVHRSLLAIAEKNMQFAGRLRAARAEATLRRERLAKIRVLHTRDSARQEEVERAAADLEIAAAQLRAVEEELAVKQLDFERARIQWNRRTIRAAATGVVLKVDKEVGEFVGPSDPQLMTIVQLDVLLAVFAVPSSQARRMQTGETVRVRLPESAAVVSGVVDSVSPVVDGRSGTMRVEVRLDNREGRFASGEPCRLLLGAATGETADGDATQFDPELPGAEAVR